LQVIGAGVGRLNELTLAVYNVTDGMEMVQVTLLR